MDTATWQHTLKESLSDVVSVLMQIQQYGYFVAWFKLAVAIVLNGRLTLQKTNTLFRCWIQKKSIFFVISILSYGDLSTIPNKENDKSYKLLCIFRSHTKIKRLPSKQHKDKPNVYITKLRRFHKIRINFTQKERKMNVYIIISFARTMATLYCDFVLNRFHGNVLRKTFSWRTHAECKWAECMWCCTLIRTQYDNISPQKRMRCIPYFRGLITWRQSLSLIWHYAKVCHFHCTAICCCWFVFGTLL